MKNTQRLLLNWKYHNSPWPRGLGGGGGGGGQLLVNVFEFPIFSALWYFSNRYFLNQTFSFFSQVNLVPHIYTITKLLLLATHIPHISLLLHLYPFPLRHGSVRRPPYFGARIHSSTIPAWPLRCVAPSATSFIQLSTPLISTPMIVYRTFSGS